MKTPERFNRAIKALVQAFFDDSLVKGSCAACACGNIIALSYGKKVVVDKINASRTVSPVTGTGSMSWYSAVLLGDEGNKEGLNQINKTGYSITEFSRIEMAFEKNTKILGSFYPDHTKEEVMKDQFNGLMAVVEVLCELDNIEPTEYKKAFEYTADFKPVTILSEVD